MINMNVWIYNRQVLNVLLMMIMLVMRGGRIMFLHSESRLEMSDILIKIIKKWRKKTQIFWSEKLKSVKVTLEMNNVFYDFCSESVSGWKVTYPGQRQESPWLNLSIISLKNLNFGIMTKFIFWELSLIDVRMEILARCLILHGEHWRWGKIKPLWSCC